MMNVTTASQLPDFPGQRLVLLGSTWGQKRWSIWHPEDCLCIICCTLGCNLPLEVSPPSSTANLCIMAPGWRRVRRKKLINVWGKVVRKYMECRWMLFDKNKVYKLYINLEATAIHLLWGFCSKMWSSPKHFVPRVALNGSHQDAHLLCPEVLQSRHCFPCEKNWLMFLPPAERAIIWHLYTVHTSK